MNDAHNEAPMGVQRAGDNAVTKGFQRSGAAWGKGLAGAWSSCCQHSWSQCWAKSPPGAGSSKGRHQGWALPTHAHQQPAQGGREGSAQTLQPRSSRALHPPVRRVGPHHAATLRTVSQRQPCSGPGAGCSGLCWARGTGLGLRHGTLGTARGLLRVPPCSALLLVLSVC